MEFRNRTAVDRKTHCRSNGISTTYIHKHLKVGDLLAINGPYGNAFRSEGSDNIVLIAGGSGMSPVKSILVDLAAKKDKRKIRYFFGAKALRDLFLLDLMHELEKNLSCFTFIPALSEPMAGDNWPGEAGLITEVVDRHLVDIDGVEAYLCGSPLMIDACVDVLKAKGLPEEKIHFDKFT